MMETRILEVESRSLRARNIEIRTVDGKIYILGSLPINSLSAILKDKQGRKFREFIAPDCFRKALLCNKIYNYRLKLLKNHYNSQEFEYDEMQFKEVDSKELRFIFILPDNALNRNLLKNIENDNASFSFGFVIGENQEFPTDEKGVNYIRKVYSFNNLLEISILDRWNLPAYPQSTGFTTEEAEIDKAIDKFLLKKSKIDNVGAKATSGATTKKDIQTLRKQLELIKLKNSINNTKEENNISTTKGINDIKNYLSRFK